MQAVSLETWADKIMPVMSSAEVIYSLYVLTIEEMLILKNRLFSQAIDKKRLLLHYQSF